MRVCGSFALVALCVDKSSLFATTFLFYFRFFFLLFVRALITPPAWELVICVARRLINITTIYRALCAVGSTKDNSAFSVSVNVISAAVVAKDNYVLRASVWCGCERKWLKSLQSRNKCVNRP